MSFVVFSDDIFLTRSAGGLMPIDSLREENLCIY